MRSSELLKRAKIIERDSFYTLFESVVECSILLKSMRPAKRKAWLCHVIEDIYEQQNGNCAICSRKLEYGQHEVDHIIPHSYGGGNERSNLQLACVSCNRQKRNSVDPNELLKYLEDQAMNL